MNKQNILIFDKDLNYANLLEGQLKNDDNCISITDNPELAMEIILSESVSLLISEYIIDDANIGFDGVALLNIAKKKNNSTHTVLLTDYSDIRAKAALNSYVDDFETKDRCVEVIGSLISILNKKFQEKRMIITPQQRTVNQKTSRFKKQLTRSERVLFNKLISNENRVVTRQELLDGLYGLENDVVDNTNTRLVDVHIGKIRAKLFHDRIVSVHGQGYMWSN